MKDRAKHILTLVFVAVAFFFAGLNFSEFQPTISNQLDKLTVADITPTPSVKVSVTSAPKPVPPKPANFTGPELFNAINQKRLTYGVSQLGRNDDLCSLASFRLNQLLPTGTIDNHAGFIALTQDKNSAFAWIFAKYNLTEFLIYLPTGTATDAVNAWDDTLGHQKLLRGGEFTSGCAYAQRGIGVALAGY